MKKYADLFDYFIRISGVFIFAIAFWLIVFMLSKGSVIVVAVYAIIILIFFILFMASKQFKKEDDNYYSLWFFTWKICDPRLIDVVYYSWFFNAALVKYKENILFRYGLLIVGNYRDPNTLPYFMEEIEKNKE